MALRSCADRWTAAARSEALSGHGTDPSRLDPERDRELDPERDPEPDPAAGGAPRGPLLPALVVGGALLVLAAFGGVALAVTLGLLVAWHEVGHVQAARRLGLPTGPYAFVPFTRRALAPASFGRTRAEQVEVALGGPLYGLHLCVPVLALAFALDGGGLRGVLALWAGLNLVNVLPLHPFDGGRIAHGLAAAVHPFAGLLVTGIGTAALAAVALATGDPLLLIVGALAVFELLREYEQWSRQRRAAASDPVAVVLAAAAHDVPLAAGFQGRRAWVLGVTWLGLLLFYGGAFAAALYAEGLGPPLGFGWGAP